MGKLEGKAAICPVKSNSSVVAMRTHAPARILVKEGKLFQVEIPGSSGSMISSFNELH